MENDNPWAEVAALLKQRNEVICEAWGGRVAREAYGLTKVFSEHELRRMLTDFFDSVVNSLENNSWSRPELDAGFADLLELLTKEATMNNVSPSAAALFVLSLKDLKKILFEELEASLPPDTSRGGKAALSVLIDKMGIFTFMRSRDRVLTEQQRTRRKASTPMACGRELAATEPAMIEGC